MNDELERAWEEAVMALLRYHHGVSLERLRKRTKTSARIAIIPAEIRTEHFPDTNLERYL
jgi:hypothetical protein